MVTKAAAVEADSTQNSSNENQIAESSNADQMHKGQFPGSIKLEGNFSKITNEDHFDTLDSLDSVQPATVTMKGWGLDVMAPLGSTLFSEFSLGQYTPDVVYWTKETILALRLGYITPWFGFGFVGGSRWEFSTLDLTQRAAPDYTLTGLRTHQLGAILQGNPWKITSTLSIGPIGEYTIWNAGKPDDHGKNLMAGMRLGYGQSMGCQLQMERSSYEKRVADAETKSEAVLVRRQRKGFTLGVDLWL